MVTGEASGWGWLAGAVILRSDHSFHGLTNYWGGGGARGEEGSKALFPSSEGPFLPLLVFRRIARGTPPWSLACFACPPAQPSTARDSTKPSPPHKNPREWYRDCKRNIRVLGQRLPFDDQSQSLRKGSGLTTAWRKVTFWKNVE